MLRNSHGISGFHASFALFALFASLTLIACFALPAQACGPDGAGASAAVMEQGSCPHAAATRASAGTCDASGATCSSAKTAGSAMETDAEICSHDARDCSQMLRAQYENRGWLGVELESTEGLPGPRVAQVVLGSPADRAGFRQGDVLTSVNGISFRYSPAEVNEFMAHDFTIGRVLLCTVKRGGAIVRLSPTLAPIPEAQLEALITRHLEQHHPEEVAVLGR